MADEPLNIDITAKDDASKVIDPLQAKVDKLEKTDPTVDVEANTRDAAGDVDTFARKLTKLSDSDQVVVLALRAGAAQSELRDLATQLATIDDTDPDIDVKIDRYNEVAGQLDQLEQKMKDIGGTSIDPDLGDTARAKLQGIGEEAAKTQGAVHSMAGNAIGDFAATATGIGPIGEALGQLTEAAAGGEASLRGLATAGLGIGAISGAIALVNIALGHFQDEARKNAEIKAFNVKNVKDYTQSILDARDAMAKLETSTTGGGLTPYLADVTSKSEQLVETWRKAGEVKLFDPTTNKIGDLLPLLVKANISADEFAKAITGDQAAMLAVDAAAGRANLTLDQTRSITMTLAEEQKNYANGARAAADQTKFFGDTQETTGRKIDQTTRYIKTQQEEIDELKRKVSDGQAWLDLQSSFDDVRTSAQAAWDAAKKGAEDADQKVRDHQTSLNNLRLQLIDYGTRILGLPREVVSTLVMHTNDEELDDTQRKLNDLKAQKEIRIKFVVDSPSGWYLLGSRTTATAAGNAAPTTNITQFVAGADVARQRRDERRRARVNGRR